MTNNNHSAGVTIGNVSGGIHGSVIAGHDVSGVTVTVGGRNVPADKAPDLGELRQLLLDIQRELDAVRKMSPGGATEQALANVEHATNAISGTVSKEEGPGVQQRLKDATSIMTTVLDGVRDVSAKLGAAGEALKPIAETLAPLVSKLAIAAVWAAKLWS